MAEFILIMCVWFCFANVSLVQCRSDMKNYYPSTTPLRVGYGAGDILSKKK